ncbi:MAG: cytochrome c [Anaerolineales bacterium]|nr:cytochrome c [Anaerolineales bacterium]
MRTWTWLGLLLVITSLTACQAPPVVGDATRGAELIKQPVIGSKPAPGCLTCHSLEPEVVLVGPSLAAIGRIAQEAAGEKTAADYLHDAITNPDNQISAGFEAGKMYQTYGDELTDQEIADLVAYLQTLK